MKHSSLEKLWEGPIPLPCLKLMELSFSFYLKELPDLSNVTNLKVLRASFCSSLSEISSIGKSTSLQDLHLESCGKLIVIPSSIGNAINLETLNVQLCKGLVEFPSSIWSLKKLVTLISAGCRKLNHLGSHLRSFPDVSGNITHFDMSQTVIKEFPSSLMAFSCLRKLSATRAESLKVFPDVPDTIEVLQLRNAGIEEIPPSIQNFSSLDLCSCIKLRTFPEISSSISYLNLSDTAIKEVPSSIWSLSRLLELNLEDCRSLRVFHSDPNNIEELDSDLSDTGTDSSGGDSDTIVPLRINLKGCKSLVSLPHIPYFVSLLDASNCESLERIDGFFANPEICLSFANCFKMSEAARELIEVSDCKVVLLPGGELPADFDHRAREGLLTVSLCQSPLPLFFRFKACLLLLPGHFIEDKDGIYNEWMGGKSLSCDIWYVQNGVYVGHGSCNYHLPAILGSTEHLYFLESSISLNLSKADVNSSELQFQFKITGKYWRVKDFAVQLLEDPDVHDDHGCSEYKESADIKIEKIYMQEQCEEETI